VTKNEASPAAGAPRGSLDELESVMRAHGSDRAGEPKLQLMGANTDSVEQARRYLQDLARIGWSVPSWPEEYGGRTAADARAFVRATRRWAPVDLYPFGPALHLVAPIVMEYGSREQQERWLEPIRSGSLIWCQLFSEPEAGSDLASVTTAAAPTDGGWLVNGQKVWSSRAGYADRGLLLARTAKRGAGRDDLTVFGLDMHSAGVTTRPIRQMNLDEHFSEVFLDRVFVPDSDRIGDIGLGWTIAKATLQHERRGDPTSSTVSPTSILRALSAALADAGRRDEAIIDELTSIHLECAALAGRRKAERLAPPPSFGPSGGSGSKLQLAAVVKRMAALAANTLPEEALAQYWDTLVLTAPSLSIRGGTDEIQRNLIAERILHLPREP
jgi:alkylation response protein AidB-like acyl-CoA dehydrogenase